MSDDTYTVRHVDGDRGPWTFDSRTEAESKLDEAADLGLNVELEDPATTDGGTAEPVEVADTPPVPEPDDADTAMPKESPAEEKARAIINQLDHTDMTRLVWDPDMAPDAVPYDPTGLPYDRPEPSAEAYDLFASVLEGVHGIQYSTESVEFTDTDDILGCTVVLSRQGEHGEKRIVGIKTRDRGNVGMDHWRERLHAKARRNALKQDIPPTWVSALLARYQEVR